MDILQLKGVLIGMILGDGTLTTLERRNNSALSISSIHKEYIEWKAEFISQLTRVRFNQCTYKDHPTWKILYKATSMQHPKFTKLRMRMYHNNTRTIDLNIMKSLTSLGLLIWYLDDGSYEKKKGIMMISSNAYSYSDNMLMAKALNDYFKLRFNVYQSFSKRQGKRYSHLHLAGKDKLKFYEEIIEPYIDQVPACMKYKFPKKERLIYLYNRMYK